MVCPYAETCGGCPHRGMSEEQYRETKTAAFRRILSGIKTDFSFGKPIFVADGTRRRAAMTFRRRKGKITLGFNEAASDNVVDCESCALLTPKLNAVLPDDTDVFITPTLEAAREVWEAGAEIIALDCTDQITHEGRPAWELLPIVKKEIPEAMIFADVSNYNEAKRAVELGADIVGPTLYGYTKETASIEYPDLREFARMCRDMGDEAYFVMEGHIYSPEDAIKCLYLGAHSVVVGSAITRPHLTAKRFVDLMSGYQNNWRDAEKSKHQKK